MYTMIAGITPALTYASQHLHASGIDTTNSFRWDVEHLLLDVPSFRPGSPDLDTVLTALPRNITVWGGNLDHPPLKGYRCFDLLKDEGYLTENAAITADCAIALMEPKIPNPLPRCNILIIGWGRIGKFLASKLKDAGCDVTVAARRESDRHKLNVLGYDSTDTARIAEDISRYDILFNTVPASVLTEADLVECNCCLKIDLASIKGIAGDDVLWARGLPGKCAPERSGKLIADTFLRILREEMP